MADRRLRVVLDLDTGRWTGNLKTATGQLRHFGSQIDSSSKQVQTMTQAMDRLGTRIRSPMARVRDMTVILGQARSAMLTLNDISTGWVMSLFKQSAEVERLTVLMKGLSTQMGDAAREKEAASNLEYLYNMARSSGFAVQQLTDSFVKFQTAGIDPTNGSLRGLVDAVSSFGGSSDTLNRAAIAIQQMAGKGVVSMEELRQQLGEAVPSALKLMARAARMSIGDLVAEISKGTVAAGPALKLMLDEMQRTYAGAGERLANTMFGQLAQVRTNLTLIATEFTGLGQNDGMFQGVVNSLKELNAMLMGNTAKQMAAEFGQTVSTIVSGFTEIIKKAIEFRQYIGAAINTIAVMMAGLMAKSFWLWMVSGMNAVRAAGGGVVAGIVKIGDAYNRNVVAVRQMAAATAQAAAAQHAASQAETAAIGQRIAALEARLVRQNQVVAALRQEEAMYRQMAAGAATPRDPITNRFIARAEATRRANNALRDMQEQSREATRMERVLAAETNAHTAAKGRLSVATAANTAATTANSVAHRTAAVAMGLARTAVTALGVAINFALGPIGMIIVGLGMAAHAAGLFTSATDKATAAAERLRQGMITADDVQRVTTNNQKIRNEVARLEKDLDRGGRMEMTSDGVAFYRRFTEADKTSIRASIEERKQEIVKGERTLSDARVTAQEQAANSAMARIDRNLSAQEAKLATSYRDTTSRLEKELAEKNITQAQHDAQLTTAQEARQRGVIDNLDKMIARFSQEREVLKAAGKDVQAHDRVLQQLSERQKTATESAKSMSDATAGGLELIQAKGDGAQKTFNKFQNEIAQGRGQIAQLEAQLRGANGALDEFMAERNSPKYANATADQMAQLEANARRIDQLKEQISLKRVMDQLGDQLAKATTESDELWRSLNNGTWEIDQRATQLRARFAGMLEGLKGADLENVKQEIEKIVEQLQRAEGIKLANAWERETETILDGLKTVEEAREAAFQREMERRKDEIAALREGSEDRLRLEQAFDDWKRAMNLRHQRDNETATVKMARDWANLGQNIEQAMAGWVDTFVDAMAEGDFNFGKFASGIIKEIIKIILQAMIAYAILSAIGMTPTNAGGEKMSMKQFMGSQIGGAMGGVSTGQTVGQANVPTKHVGGLIGGPGDAAIVSSAAFAGAKKYHEGGYIGGRRLMPGEVPIIGKKRELVLTEDQQNLLSGQMKSQPGVTLNIINNSGTDIEAEESEPRFDGKQMILDVVIEATTKSTRFRDTLKGALNG